MVRRVCMWQKGVISTGRAKPGPRALAQLGLVDDDDELLGHHLDHLLAEESAAAALDEGEVGVDLVGTVDGDVEDGLLVEGAEGDVERLRLLASALGGGDGDDVLQLAGLELLAEAFDGEVGGGSRAEADDHAGLDVVVDRLVADELLELILGGRHGAGREGGGAGGLGGAGLVDAGNGGSAERDRRREERGGHDGLRV